MRESWLNTGRDVHTERERELVGVGHAARARSFFLSRQAYRPTPLRALPALAGTAGVASIRLKDESGRMGLGSFKALGGMYAVTRLAEAEAQELYGPRPTEEQLRTVAARVPFVCASAGNHGLSVAAGARALGAEAIVLLGEDVPEEFAERLRAHGAQVRRSGSTYEQSMSDALELAARHGWRLVSDSSWDGYTTVPLDIMRGYTVLFDEVGELGGEAAGGEGEDGDGPAGNTGAVGSGNGGGGGDGAPTHVFVQAGVGGLAAAAAGYARDRWGERPRIVVVEPEAAPCLLASVRAGRPVRVEGGRTTLGRLDCREPSLLAWRLLSRLADAFVTVTDTEAEEAAGLLAAEGVRVSPCGAAGAAGLLALPPAARAALEVGPDSRVLLVGTEAAL
ncbi:pyridoxal-phosphate dependent enzyme [Streptosporangium carneum]|uniref:PLP-dependent lyase/thiolase n=1 Tax=Streptosporangium carneum TaxID=47481 RepID=A0A9W6I8U1_9ACTN|nr:pyridoxal-phosphate dependent enzyme [Streptosporangium carneum]GLK13099.1 PLP-dependent lyase/thiolase [Streptosporangium carneum]